MTTLRSLLRPLALVAILTLATGAAAPSKGPARSGRAAERGAAKPVTLKGEIVDLGCYLMHEGQGDEHAACAQACVKAGAPVGLLAEGALYVLFAPHETAAPFEEAKRLVGRSAVVTGVVHDRAGLRGLAVTLVAARS